MSTNPNMDDAIEKARNLTGEEQFDALRRLVNNLHPVDRSWLLYDVLRERGLSRGGYIDTELFTGTWAYDQVWDSLRSFSQRQEGGKEAFMFRQTGPQGYFLNGFEFGRKDSRPVFALVMGHFGNSEPEVDQMILSEINSFFEDGVQVVWEVDVKDGCAIRVHRAPRNDDNQGRTAVYRLGEVADAEPVLPGWRMAVSELLYHRDPGIMSATALVGPTDGVISIPGKAEIIRGEIVHYSLAGGLSGWAADQILRSLQDYALRTGAGIAVGDNKAFLVDVPGRRSFSPNVAFHPGKLSAGYYHGAPLFAVEIRNGLDYSNDGHGRVSAKIEDYFHAGTEVVWDVDVLVDDRVLVYRKAAPREPTVYGRGQVADAEPALPGWSMRVDDLFYSDPER